MKTREASTQSSEQTGREQMETRGDISRTSDVGTGNLSGLSAGEEISSRPSSGIGGGEISGGEGGIGKQEAERVGGEEQGRETPPVLGERDYGVLSEEAERAREELFRGPFSERPKVVGEGFSSRIEQEISPAEAEQFVPVQGKMRAGQEPVEQVTEVEERPMTGPTQELTGAGVSEEVLPSKIEMLPSEQEVPSGEQGEVNVPSQESGQVPQMMPIGGVEGPELTGVSKEETEKFTHLKKPEGIVGGTTSAPPTQETKPQERIQPMEESEHPEKKHRREKKTSVHKEKPHREHHGPVEPHEEFAHDIPELRTERAGFEHIEPSEGGAGLEQQPQPMETQQQPTPSKAQPKEEITKGREEETREKPKEEAQQVPMEQGETRGEPSKEEAPMAHPEGGLVPQLRAQFEQQGQAGAKEHPHIEKKHRREKKTSLHEPKPHREHHGPVEPHEEFAHDIPELRTERAGFEHIEPGQEGGIEIGEEAKEGVLPSEEKPRERGAGLEQQRKIGGEGEAALPRPEDKGKKPEDKDEEIRRRLEELVLKTQDLTEQQPEREGLKREEQPREKQLEQPSEGAELEQREGQPQQMEAQREQQPSEVQPQEEISKGREEEAKPEVSEKTQEVTKKETREKRKEDQKLCIIAGAADGFGLDLARSILKNKPNYTIFLCDMNEISCQTAVSTLKDECKDCDARFHQLDANSMVSLRTFRDFLLDEFGENCIDILFSNVGLMLNCKQPDQPAESFELTKEIFDDTIRQSYFGNLSLCLELFPLLADDARVVFISSRFGQAVFMNINETLQQRIRTCQSIDQANEIMELLISSDSSALKGLMSKSPDTQIYGSYNLASILPYGMAKLGVTLLGMCYQHQLDEEKSKRVAINMCCPGIETGNRPVDQLVETPLWLALEQPSDSSIRGQFCADRKVIDPFVVPTMQELF